MNKTDVSCSGLVALANLPHLTTLTLIDAEVTDDDIDKLALLQNLNTLYLNDTGITDIGLLELSRMSGLCKIDVSGTHVTRAGLDAYQRRNPRVIVTSDVGTTALSRPEPRHEHPSQSLVGCTAIPLNIEFWISPSRITQADLKGKVVVLDFWAMWCPPCVAALPVLQDLQDEYPDSLVVIGLTKHYGYGWNADEAKPVRLKDISRSEERLAITQFAGYHDVRYPMGVLDDSSPMWSDYLVSAIPQVVVIDSQGMIRYVAVGFSVDKAKNLRSTVESLIADGARKEVGA